MDMSDENRNALLEAGRKLLEARRKQLLAGGSPTSTPVVPATSLPTHGSSAAATSAPSKSVTTGPSLDALKPPLYTNGGASKTLEGVKVPTSSNFSALTFPKDKPVSSAPTTAPALSNTTTRAAPLQTNFPTVATAATSFSPTVPLQDYEKLKAELTATREKLNGLESSLSDRDQQLRAIREESSRLQQHQQQQKAAAEADQRAHTESSQKLAEVTRARDEALQRVKDLESAMQERQRMAAALQQQINEQRLYQERLEADVNRSRDQLEKATAQRDDTVRTVDRATREIASLRDTLTTLTNDKSALVEQLRQRDVVVQKLQHQMQTLETDDAMREAQNRAQASAELKRMEELLTEKDEIIGSIQKINQQLYSEQTKLKAEQHLAQQMIEENLKMVTELENAMEQMLHESASASPSADTSAQNEQSLKEIRIEAENIARVFASEITRLREEINAAAPFDGSAHASPLEELQERKIIQLLAAMDALTQVHNQHVEQLAKARLLDAELRAAAQVRQQIAERCLAEKQSYLAQLESELNRNGALLAEVARVRELLRPEQSPIARQVLERLERLETQEELAAQKTRLGEVTALLVDSRLDKMKNTEVAPLPPLKPEPTTSSSREARPPGSPGFADVPLTPAPASVKGTTAAGAPSPAKPVLKPVPPKEQGGSNCTIS